MSSPMFKTALAAGTLLAVSLAPPRMLLGAPASGPGFRTAGVPAASVAASPAMVSPFDQRLEEASALHAQQRYHKASVALFELLAEPLPTVTAARARLMLGQCLEAINLPVLAGLYYRDAVRLGPGSGEAYSQAVAAWTALSIRQDDAGDLEARVRRLPQAADPPQVPALSYLRGLSRFESGEIEPALALLKQAATPETLVGRQASYIAALASIKAGKREDAWALLEPLTHGTPRGANGELSADEAALASRLQELAQLALARIRYAEGKLEEAQALYEKIDAKSTYQPRVRYEEAWIGFFQDHLLQSLTDLAAIRLGSGQGFIVEADLLAAMFYLRTSQFDLADGVLRSYLDQLYPVRIALRDITRSYGAREDRLELARLLLGVSPAVPGRLSAENGTPAPVGTPTDQSGATVAEARDPVDVQAAQAAAITLKPVLNELAGDRELTRALARTRRCLADSEMLERMPSWWRATPFAQSLPAALGKEERRSLEDVGLRLQTGLLHYRMFLSELNVVGLALRREVTTQRLARATRQPDPDPYTGEPLPPFDFIHPAESK